MVSLFGIEQQSLVPSQTIQVRSENRSRLHRADYRVRLYLFPFFKRSNDEGRNNTWTKRYAFNDPESDPFWHGGSTELRCDQNLYPKVQSCFKSRLNKPAIMKPKSSQTHLKPLEIYNLNLDNEPTERLTTHTGWCNISFELRDLNVELLDPNFNLSAFPNFSNKPSTLLHSNLVEKAFCGAPWWCNDIYPTNFRASGRSGAALYCLDSAMLSTIRKRIELYVFQPSKEGNFVSWLYRTSDPRGSVAWSILDYNFRRLASWAEDLQRGLLRPNTRSHAASDLGIVYEINSLWPSLYQFHLTERGIETVDLTISHVFPATKDVTGPHTNFRSKNITDHHFRPEIGGRFVYALVEATFKARQGYSPDGREHEHCENGYHWMQPTGKLELERVKFTAIL
jgi:hypothetical protein